jgi:hypothetical protein
MESKTILITPELAEELLTRNPRNRPFAKSNLNYLKSQLNSGEWKLTHQGIAICLDGTILDGQHRLKAVQETGISVEMLVTTSIDPNVFSVLDTGKKRNGADVLSVNGANNTHCMAAAIRNFLLYKQAPNLVWSGHYAASTVTNLHILEEYKSDPEGWQWATALAKKFEMSGIVVPGPFGCLIYAAMCKGHAASTLEQFAENIKEGIALKRHDPILAFRNKCFLSSDKKRRSQNWLANYIKVFNYSFTGQELKIFKDQEFPPMPSIVDFQGRP